MVSISPVPKLLPGPVSYFQLPASTPLPDPPLKSSLQVRLKPLGGAGTAAGAASGTTAAVRVVPAPAGAAARPSPPRPSATVRKAPRVVRMRTVCLLDMGSPFTVFTVGGKPMRESALRG